MIQEIQAKFHTKFVVICPLNPKKTVIDGKGYSWILWIEGPFGRGKPIAILGTTIKECYEKATEYPVLENNGN